MNQTSETLRQRLDLEEAMTRTAKATEIETQADSGEWFVRAFANEGAAREYEAKMKKQGVPHRRPN